MQITFDTQTAIYGAIILYCIAHLGFGLIRHLKMLRQPEIEDVATFPIFGMFIYRMTFGFPIVLIGSIIQAVWIPLWNIGWAAGWIGCKIGVGRPIKYMPAPRWPLGMTVSAQCLKGDSAIGIAGFFISSGIIIGVALALLWTPYALIGYCFALVLAAVVASEATS